jgi:hypothetical protein
VLPQLYAGDDQKTSPPAEKTPDLKREEHIQLGTNFVTRLEVRRQPLAQIRSYLERQMGLTESETNEVLRRSGIDPTAGQAEQISGRDAYLASRRKSETRQSSRAISSNAEQSNIGNQTESFQPGQVPTSLAYAAAAAALAPPQRSWKSWLFGPSAEDATLKAYHSYQQQLLQHAYSAEFPQYSPSTIVLQPGDVGAAAPMGSGSWMSRRLVLVLVIVCVLARAGLARWLLYRVAAWCGALPHHACNSTGTNRIAMDTSLGVQGFISQQCAGCAQSGLVTTNRGAKPTENKGRCEKEKVSSSNDDDVAALHNQIATLREQIRSNRKLLADIDKHDAKDADSIPQPEPEQNPETAKPPTSNIDTSPGLGNIDEPDTPSDSHRGRHGDQATEAKLTKKMKKPKKHRVAQTDSKRSEGKPEEDADTVRSIPRPSSVTSTIAKKKKQKKRAIGKQSKRTTAE